MSEVQRGSIEGGSGQQHTVRVQVYLSPPTQLLGAGVLVHPAAASVTKAAVERTTAAANKHAECFHLELMICHLSYACAHNVRGLKIASFDVRQAAAEIEARVELAEPPHMPRRPNPVYSPPAPRRQVRPSPTLKKLSVICFR